MNNENDREVFDLCRSEAEMLDDIFAARVRGIEKKRWLKSLALRLMIAAAAAYLLFGVIFGVGIVKGSSMVPAYRDGDLILFFRPGGSYGRGDVVLIESGIAGEDYIKRVVATPGQTVDAEGFTDSLLIDGESPDEPYIYTHTEAKDHLTYPVTLGEKEYFVLGDNRTNSVDSRNYGAVKENDIQGRVIAVLRFP